MAWILPWFANVARDLRRSLAAINFSSADRPALRFVRARHRVEHRQPARDAQQRDARGFSRRIRAAVGPDYALGAIVPDLRGSNTPPALWPFFPYKEVAKIYDAFLPMAYTSVRVEGRAGVYRYTRANIDFIRARAGKKARVHMIGGIANQLDSGEAKAVVQAARDAKALGASFYDLPLSGPEEFSAQRKLKPSGLHLRVVHAAKIRAWAVSTSWT